MSWFHELDRALLLFLNHLKLPWDLDWILVTLTTANTSKNFFWIAIPLVIAVFVFFLRKKAPLAILMTAILAAAADQFNYRILKSLTFRVRPFSAIQEVVLRVPYGPKSSSFPSNHATTTMALAVWLTYLFPAGAPLFYGIAFVIGISRVYVGVHYPSDVLAGWAIGALFGTLMVYAGRKLLKLRPNPREID